MWLGEVVVQRGQLPQPNAGEGMSFRRTAGIQGGGGVPVSPAPPGCRPHAFAGAGLSPAWRREIFAACADPGHS